MGPVRNFPEARDNLSSLVARVEFYTGFRFFPRTRELAMKPGHGLRESTDPTLTGFSQEFSGVLNNNEKDKS
jgi:hypothetical protein